MLLRDFNMDINMGTAITGTQMRTPKAFVVTELPDKGASNKIYYVPNGTAGNNKYDEYIWIKDADHPNGYFEKIGQRDINLEPYALKEEVDKKLNTKVDKVEGKGLSANDFTNELKQTLEDLNSWNYIGILSSWNGIAKLTTESTEADILTALTITPLRGNKINTKTELFKVLDECAINKKFLKESSTNAMVFVEFIGSCYVIQIIGNKAAALNGRLVGTPVIRHITISGNPNETLTVLKAPFEIKLEDINKKVASLETQVKDLTDRITALESK